MAAKRKRVSMVLTISVPVGLTAAQARNEVRCRINELSGCYDAFNINLPDSAEDEAGNLRIKVAKLAPAKG